MDNMLKEMTTKGHQKEKSHSFFGGMVYDLCDAISTALLLEQRSLHSSDKALYTVNFRKKPGSADGGFTYQGTSCWHKTYFVLSKIDNVYRSACNGAKSESQKRDAVARAVNGQYMELGVLLGSSLKRLR